LTRLVGRTLKNGFLIKRAIRRFAVLNYEMAIWHKGHSNPEDLGSRRDAAKNQTNYETNYRTPTSAQ
jgi:hypothetical protein